MSFPAHDYPEVLYVGEEREASATFRPASTPPDLTTPGAGTSTTSPRG